MTDPKLIEYVKSELAVGIPPEKIRSVLASASWTKEDIAAAFEANGIKVLPNGFLMDGGTSKNSVHSRGGTPSGSPKYLAIALGLGVAGFGTCTVGLNSVALLFLASILYLLSCASALAYLIHIYGKDRNSVSLVAKIVGTIMALGIGGWSGYWGFIGLAMSLGGGSLL